METIDISGEKIWQEKLSHFSTDNFLQSWNWGDFQEALGNKETRVSIEGGLAQYYLVTSKFSNFIYCPRGPLATSSDAYSELLDRQEKDARECGADFILIEPSLDPGFVVTTLQKKGFIKQNSTTQPGNTSIISLKPDTDSIYSQIRKTTRHMILNALDKHVEVKSYQDLSRWNDFVSLFTETTQRQKFTPHTLRYIKKQFECLGKNGSMKLYLAEADGKALAGAIILFYAKTGTYLHAGSNNLGRELGAAQLLVWTAIQDAKKEGDEFFDFWGIAPENEPNHPWKNITMFKKGFGGETVSYPGGFILPIRASRYNIYRLISFLRATPPFRITHRILLKAITKG